MDFRPRGYSILSTRSGNERDSDYGPQTKEQAFKIILIGDSGVGKTMILKRLIQNKFDTNHHITVGVEFSSYNLEIDSETSVKLQIWDTAGQESFHSIIKSFYRNAAAVFLVYNICSRSSFEQLNDWIEEARMLVDDDTTFVLIGNQADQEARREVDYAEAEKYMREKNISLFFETSALDGQNIEMAFREAGSMVYLKYLQSQLKNKAFFEELGRSSIIGFHKTPISNMALPTKDHRQCSCIC